MLIAQLSDPHIRPADTLYQGRVDSNAMFRAAIDQLHQLHPRPDLLIISGDLVDEGSPAEYAMARKLLAGVRQPLLLIPGNHDEREAFRAAFADHDYLPSSGPLHFIAANHGPLRIIGLDVTVPGEHHGDMSEAVVSWLEQALAREPQRPTLIMLHQPPFDSGIPYIDLYKCRNGHQLEQLVSCYPAVERVVCGHIHRSMQLRFGGTLLCTAPSTTTAIALRLDPDAEEASYIEPPAMLLHHWRAETGLITHWLPIGSFSGPLPFA